MVIVCPVEFEFLDWSHRPTRLKSTELASSVTTAPDALWSLNWQVMRSQP